MRQVIICLSVLFFNHALLGQFSYLAQGKVSGVELTSIWSQAIFSLHKSDQTDEQSLFLEKVFVDPQVAATSFKVANRIFLPKKRADIDYKYFSYKMDDAVQTNLKPYELFYTEKGLLYVPYEIADALALKLKNIRYQRFSETMQEDEQGYEFSFSSYHQGAKLALAIKLDMTIQGKSYQLYEFSKQRGGIERHYDALTKTSKNQLILVNGNSRVDKEFYEKLYEGSIKYYQKLAEYPYHAHAVGLSELIGGLDFFQNQKKINFLNANLYLDNGAYFKEYEIFEINGKRIGVTSVVSLKTQERLKKYYQSPFQVIDPSVSIKKVIKDLSGRVDYFILMLPENRSDLDKYKKIYGVDLIITNQSNLLDFQNVAKSISRKKQPIELRKPMSIVQTNRSKIVRGEIQINDNLAVEQSSIYLLDNLIYGGFEGFYLYEELSNFTHQDNLLPKASTVYPYKLSYSAEDINKVLCDLMLDEIQTDICIISTDDLGFNPPDGLSEVIIKRWFKKRYLVTASFTGEKLLAFINEQKNNTSSFLIQGYQNGKVRGVPIRKEQTYTIVTTSELFRKADKLKSLDHLKNKKTNYGQADSIKLVSSFFIENLKKRSDKDQEKRRQDVLKIISNEKNYSRGQWRARVKKLDLNFSQRSSREVDPSFNARDNRVFTNDQTSFQIEADSSVYYQNGLYTAETGEEISYAKERIENSTSSVTNVISDSIFVFSKHSFFWKENTLGEISPYTQLGYKTQFEKTQNGRQSLWTLDLGMKFENTKLYDLFQVGPFAEIDYSNENQTPGRYGGGIAFRYRLSKPLFEKKMSLEIESDYSYYYRRSNPNLDNIEQLWDSRVSLVTRLFENVNFGPFVQYFYFHSINGDTSGGFFTMGVQFLYRGDWTF